jgi:hypothetical protein
VLDAVEPETALRLISVDPRPTDRVDDCSLHARAQSKLEKVDGIGDVAKVERAAVEDFYTKRSSRLGDRRGAERLVGPRLRGDPAARFTAPPT